MMIGRSRRPAPSSAVTIIRYYCNLSGALIKAFTNAQKGDLYLLLGSLRDENGDRWPQAVDVLWVSTGFFVGVIDMAVVL